ncbi:hypothetical protein LTS10_008027 [Elasticomyces elasticus]|nr:hypothetical protein LTS10_008027 [Elasticomyces elasticus]
MSASKTKVGKYDLASSGEEIELGRMKQLQLGDDHQKRRSEQRVGAMHFSNDPASCLLRDCGQTVESETAILGSLTLQDELLDLEGTICQDFRRYAALRMGLASAITVTDDPPACTTPLSLQQWSSAKVSLYSLLPIALEDLARS